MLKVRYEVVEEINVQISTYEQRGQTEQAKHRLCTLLHVMGLKRHRHRDLAKDVSTQRYARVRQLLQ